MANNIPPDFIKGQKPVATIRCSECEVDLSMNNMVHDIRCSKIQGMLKRPISQKEVGPIIPLDLAFTIQDPCGNTAIALAREVLTLISNREDDSICQSLIHEIQRLNKLYPR